MKLSNYLFLILTVFYITSVSAQSINIQEIDIKQQNLFEDTGKENIVSMLNLQMGTNDLSLSSSGIVPPALDCSNAIPIFCGDTLTGDNTTGNNNVSAYDCYGINETGNEVVYEFSLDITSTVTITNIESGNNIDHFLLSDCDENSCISYEFNSSTTNLDPGTYYIVVDGYNGFNGPYTLIVNCTPCAPAPEVTSFAYTTPNPACEGAPQNINIMGTPYSSVIINLNGGISTVNLNSYGNFTGSTGYGPGTWNNNLVSISLNGCTVDLSNEPTLVFQVDSAQVNDTCSTAIPIESGDVISGFTGSACNRGYDNTCSTWYQYYSEQDYGLWYEYTGNGDLASFTTCSASTDYDTRISVFTGTCGDLTCLVDNDDDYNCYGYLQSSIDVQTVCGTSYYIYITGYSPSNRGTFELSVSSTSTYNDTCVNAIPISCGETLVNNNSCASSQSLPDCAYSGVYDFQALWYSFEGDGNTFIASLCSETTDFNTNIAIYEEGCDTLTCVTNDVDGCGTNAGASVASISTVAGKQYLIAVAGFNLSQEGNFALTLICECNPTLSLNGNPDPSGTYQANNWLESSSKINAVSGGAVNYNAGNEYIELKNGFDVDGINEFNAVIQGCGCPADPINDYAWLAQYVNYPYYIISKCEYGNGLCTIKIEEAPGNTYYYDINGNQICFDSYYDPYDSCSFVPINCVVIHTP